MDGNGSAEDIWERLAHHMLSQLRDEIRQGFANSSANIVEEIKQLLSSGSLVPCTIEEGSNLDTQTSDIFSREPTHQGESGLLDQPGLLKSNTKDSFRSTRIQRTSSTQDLETYAKQISNAVFESGNLANKSFGHFVDNVMHSARQRYARDDAYQQKCLYHLVRSKRFSTTCMLMILANAAWMGYESDHRASAGAGWLKNVGLTFNVWFTFELLLKIIAFRTEFFCGPDHLWNLLDLFLVLCSIPEYFSNSIRVSFIRILRLGRLTRAFRVVRLLKYLSSLREILISLLHTLASLFWSFVAMILATYVWALLFMQSLGFHFDQGVQFSSEENFKNVRLTMMTMYGCITGGMDWFPFVMDFEQHGAYLAEYVLLIYIFFMTFGFVNVVISVFCARANEATNHNHEMRNDKEQEKQTKMVNDLVHIFHRIDTERRGFIEKTQFLTFAANSEAQTMLQFYGLPTFALEKMWRIMDEYDGEADERVNLVSFLMAFMRLSGNSIATEVMILSLQVVEVRSDIKEIVDRISQLEPALHRCASKTSLKMSKDAPRDIQCL